MVIKMKLSKSKVALPWLIVEFYWEKRVFFRDGHENDGVIQKFCQQVSGLIFRKRVLSLYWSLLRCKRGFWDFRTGRIEIVFFNKSKILLVLTFARKLERTDEFVLGVCNKLGRYPELCSFEFVEFLSEYFLFRLADEKKPNSSSICKKGHKIWRFSETSC